MKLKNIFIEGISYGQIKDRLGNKSHEIREEIKEKERGRPTSVLLERKRKE